MMLQPKCGYGKEDREGQMPLMPSERLKSDTKITKIVASLNATKKFQCWRTEGKI
jgi:hypothetical protein